ncbi:hypothetical protein RhiJN_25820 [Ceratobasidium sp. AG-Ba]|nr:hypothetical protein RhiJN_25820 [Ceratobasidium sp. AG-Ba]
MSFAKNLVSSPIKQSGPPTESVRASEAQYTSRDRMLVSDVSGTNFVDTYLQDSLSNLPKEWSEYQAGLVQSIQSTPDGSETQLYSSSGPLLALLNSISAWVHQSRNAPGSPVLVFSSCDRKIIKTPYIGHHQKPDVVACWEDAGVLQQIHSQINPARTDSPTWYETVTVGEVKVGKKDRHQVGNYVRHLLRHHPELDAVLGFFARREGYQLVYHDASAIQLSEHFSWSPVPIYAYVNKLYGKPFQDATMYMLDGNRAVPSWATKIENQVYVIKSAYPELGPGQRRFTGIAINVVTAALIFIKDVWRNARRRYFEGLMYEKAHAGDSMAGLMILGHHGYVQDKLGERVRTTNLNVDTSGKTTDVRYKMRITTPDIGRSLNDIKKLSEFLRVMYDACVVQRNLYRKCKVLHRDISDTNIMLAPDSEAYRERCATGYAQVKFINQVLSGNKDEKPSPACLIIDLGNGADLMELGGQEALAERTGTPKFIARSVSCGELLDRNDYSSNHVHMPLLEGRPLELYQHACVDSYDNYSQALGKKAECHPNPVFAHQLFHDAESTFWVIAWTLARSAGEDYQKETAWNNDFTKFVNTMREHYPSSEEVDSRLAIPSSESKWQSILHNDLHSLAPMLSRMFSYVRPEWAYRNDLDAEHVHEAMMRLLLPEIVRLSEADADIPLSIGVRSLPPSRSVLRRSHSSASFSTDLQVSCSRTQSTHEHSRSVLPDPVASNGSRPARKRKSSHWDEESALRPSPRLVPSRTPKSPVLPQPGDDSAFLDWLRDEVHNIQWGSVGDLQEPVYQASSNVVV